MTYNPHVISHVINELEVELCLEIARQYDQEDLTHPPHRLHDEDHAIRTGDIREKEGPPLEEED